MSTTRESRRVVDAQVRPATRGKWLDTAFLVTAGVQAAWFALLLLGNTFQLGWSLALLVPFWAVTAYLTLPRLHRILTSVYLPDYFFGRTRTSEGMLGDPVNLAVDGTAAQIHAAMTAAGWTLADPVNLRTSWRIVVSSVLGRSYPEAPVSPLHLFGRKQDLAYQQEVEGSPSQRHHVRFWRVPDGWPLPGGRRVGWLGAGTFDTAVGLSLFTLQVTHRIDEDIDVERDHIVDSVNSAPGVGDRVSVDVIREFSSGYHHRNGGGDRVRTDGDLPVIDLRRVPATLADGHPAAVRAAASGFAMPEGPSASPDADWRGGGTSAGPVHRPPALLLAMSMLVISIVVQSALLARGLTSTAGEFAAEFDLDDGEPDSVATVLVALGVWVAVLIILTALTLRGRKIPRLALMTLLAAAVFLQLLDGRAAQGGGDVSVHLITTAVGLIALLALSSDDVRHWVRHRS